MRPPDVMDMELLDPVPPFLMLDGRDLPQPEEAERAETEARREVKNKAVGGCILISGNLETSFSRSILTSSTILIPILLVLLKDMECIVPSCVEPAHPLLCLLKRRFRT